MESVLRQITRCAYNIYPVDIYVYTMHDVARLPAFRGSRDRACGNKAAAVSAVSQCCCLHTSVSMIGQYSGRKVSYIQQ